MGCATLIEQVMGLGRNMTLVEALGLPTVVVTVVWDVATVVWDVATVLDAENPAATS